MYMNLSTRPIQRLCHSWFCIFSNWNQHRYHFERSVLVLLLSNVIFMPISSKWNEKMCLTDFLLKAYWKSIFRSVFIINFCENHFSCKVFYSSVDRHPRKALTKECFSLFFRKRKCIFGAIEFDINKFNFEAETLSFSNKAQ